MCVFVHLLQMLNPRNVLIVHRFASGMADLNKIPEVMLLQKRTHHAVFLGFPLGCLVESQLANNHKQKIETKSFSFKEKEFESL